MPVFSKEFDAYEEGYRMLCGDHYTDGEKEWWETQRRPVNVWNIIFPTFNQILGDFLLSLGNDKVYPDNFGSAFMAEAFNKVIDRIEIDNDFKSEMGQTLLAGLVKRGWVYSRYSNERSLNGSVVISNIDEFEIMFDSRAKGYYLEDARYLIRSKWLTTDQIFAAWPEHRGQLKQLLIDKEQSSFWDGVSSFQYSAMNDKNFVDFEDGKYRVLEFHFKSEGAGQIAYNAETDESYSVNLEGKKADQWLAANPGFELIEIPNQERIQVDELLPGLSFFLNRREADIQDGHWDYTPFSAYNYGKKTLEHFGVLKNAIGPQKDFNDTRNRIADILNKTANPGSIVNLSKIENARHVANHGGETGLQIQAKPDADINEVYKANNPPNINIGQLNYEEKAMTLISKIVNLTENMSGETQTGNENATLFANRVQRAHVAFAPVVKNRNRTISRVKNRTIRLIQENYDSHEYWMFSNPLKGGVEQEFDITIINRILKDLRTSEYFVYASAEDINQTTRALKFMQKTELVQMIGQMLGPLAIEYRWWLEDADLGDIEELIRQIETVLQQQVETQENAAAAQEMNMLMDAAQKRLALEGAAASQQPPKGADVSGLPS